MAKFIFNKKVITSSKCRLMQHSNDPDPFFCKIVLTKDELIFLNDEYLKRDELLFRIPIYRIKEFSFINEKEKKKDNLISFFQNIFGILLLVLGGRGFMVDKANNPDILCLSFVNEQEEESNFILNMMVYGDSGLIREYKKLIKQ